MNIRLLSMLLFLGSVGIGLIGIAVLLLGKSFATVMLFLVVGLSIWLAGFILFLYAAFFEKVDKTNG